MRKILFMFLILPFILSSCATYKPYEPEIVQRDNPYNRINHTESTETYTFSYYAEEIRRGDPHGYFTDLMNLDVGSVFHFGLYNGQPMEWVVVEKNGRKIRAVKTSVIQYEWPTFIGLFGLTPEEELEGYLNSEFLMNSFSEAERKLIGYHVEFPKDSLLQILSSQIYNRIGDGIVYSDDYFYEGNYYWWGDVIRISDKILPIIELNLEKDSFIY